MAAPELVPRRGREREREDESEDESDILEESPCGRWQKRREQVNQGNMPGVQSTFLAMDTEEGVEVVWNELHFADRKAFLVHEEKIQTMFEQLALVDHPNIVKLHKYWLDASESRARVIFITEYVSSGSLKQFLKKTKKNHKAMNARVCKWAGVGQGQAGVQMLLGTETVRGTGQGWIGSGAGGEEGAARRRGWWGGWAGRDLLGTQG
uniref:Serine-threonine/tyrosine-protein kinase catalytic domain-containing protein n=1 Tax=Bos indicus x Bos taurus TaxID=30522 RepID=A0A4W2F6B5_BOBOX